MLREKERIVPRRHGALLRSGQGVLPDETTLCATCWMHGVFAAQLTIGNTSFHKLFSVSRDPYNITRASGLRLLLDAGDGWRLLAVPSVFEIGLSDCRWIYRLAGRTITVHAVASGDDPAMQWRIAVEGTPCRFLVFGHVVLGERELEHTGRIETDARRKQFAFGLDPDGLWGQRYPNAVYFLVTSTPDQSKRSAATSCCTSTARPAAAPTRRCGRDRPPNCASPCGLDDAARRSTASRGEVRARCERRSDAGARNELLAKGHPGLRISVKVPSLASALAGPRETGNGRGR